MFRRGTTVRGVNGELRQLLIGELQRGSNVSQRTLARRLGVAVATVNRVLSDLVEAGYVEVSDRAVRPFAYRVTGDGERYQRRLSLEQYSSALSSLRRLEQRIRSTLCELKDRGVKRVVFYGAGQVMEATYRVASGVGLDVIGVVDDDPAKQGLGLWKAGLVVEPPRAINDLRPDAVLITTSCHAEEIQRKMDAPLRSSVEVREI
jgi:DNA-binding transcriptional regulator YhcF (GntR family)